MKFNAIQVVQLSSAMPRLRTTTHCEADLRIIPLVLVPIRAIWKAVLQVSLKKTNGLRNLRIVIPWTTAQMAE